MERWVSQQGSFMSSTKWLAGDFDDDGRTDLAAVYNDLGSASIDVWLSTGSTFVRQRLATRQGAFWDTQKWFAGDFDGDGHADLANVFNDQNQITIDVHLWTRNGFTQQRWATLQGDFWDAQQWVAGDFDGDRYTDLANVFNDSGQTSIDLHRSTGSAFKFQRWMTRKIPFSDTQRWLFDGLGVGDPGTAFLTVFDDQGRISVDMYLRSGTTLVRAQQGRQIAAQKWFSGRWGGGANLAKVFNDDGQASIDVVTDTTEQRLATRQGTFWDSQQWLAGDFDRDQVSDLANVFSDNGSISIDVHRNPRP
jgi:2-phospho-L-lactate guanylyltransferase (CobY/MobA/RfbA family)